ncbi:hypothetical protein ACBQ19_20330 [Hafnia alvei]
MSGKKTITIRDSSESHFEKGELLSVSIWPPSTRVFNAEVSGVPCSKT